MAAGAGGASLLDSEIEAFKYENLKIAFVSDADIHAEIPFRAASEGGFNTDSAYMRLRYETKEKEERAKNIAKIHLSIATTKVGTKSKLTEDYVKEAWNAILPIIIKHKVICSKVYIQTEENKGFGQKGKAIVFYMRNEKEIDYKKYWNDFLKEIENSLLAVEEHLGHKISGETPILRYDKESSEQAIARNAKDPRFENSIENSRFFYYSQELPKGSEVPEVPEILSAFKSDARAIAEAGGTRTFTSILTEDVSERDATADKTS